MTTQDWITKNKNITGKGTKHFASIMRDDQGFIYSYGTHYVLLFTLKGKEFINNAGYSNTTARHINWASTYGDSQLRVPLSRDTSKLISNEYASEDQKLAAVIADTLLARDEVVKTMTAKKRKDTQVYKHLEYQLDQFDKTITAARELA